jgi:hypothetical protein
MVNHSHKRAIHILGIVIGVIVWLANSFNPPNGQTGAPFDGSCANCHTGGNYIGNVELEGLPGTIVANTTYNLTLHMTPISGNPVRGGFQLVAVDDSNANAGDLMSINGETGTEFSGGREYVEQRGTKTFGGNAISWEFNWTAPSTAAGNTIKMYFIGNFTNGNGSTSGDKAIAEVESYPFQAAGPPLSVGIVSFQNVSCFGGSDGNILATGQGGTPPFSYQWSNGQTGENATNLPAGNYTVTVTDQAGASATVSRSLTQPAVLAVQLTSTNIITCSVPTTVVAASALGGVSPYQYEWSNGDFGENITVAAAGSYVVTITDANGCTKTGQIAVIADVTIPLAVATAPGPITCTVQQMQISGAGSSQGQQYSYSWTTNDGNIVQGQNTLSPLIDAAGTYTLLVTNTSNGCTNADVVTVSIDTVSPPLAVINGLINCFQSTDTLFASAGPLQATFSWLSGPSGWNVVGPWVVVEEPGEYIVTATAINGCTATDTAYLVAFDPVDVALSSTPTSGVGIHDATATAQANGGDGMYSYEWNTGDTSPSIEQLGPGVYTVTVVDGQGCSDTQSVTINPFNCAISSFVDVVGVSCYGGNDGRIEYLVVSGNLDTTIIQNGLIAGSYMLNYTDDNGCFVQDTAVVTQPDSLQIGAIITHASCPEVNDGALNITWTGGTSPMELLLLNEAGNPVQQTQMLGIGNYLAILTDSQGCNSQKLLEIVSADTTAPILNCPLQVALCFGDTVRYDLPEGSDNCSLDGRIPVLISGIPQGSVMNQFTSTQVYELYDASENRTVCAITLIAGEVPEVSLVRVLDDVGNAGVGVIEIAVGSGSSPFLSYTWFRDGVPYPGATNLLENLNTGAYTVQVLDELTGCASVFGPIEVKNTVGTRNIAAQRDIVIMPNPSNRIVYIDWQGFQPEQTIILDPIGNQCLMFDKTRVLIDVSLFFPGNYTLVSVDGSGQMVVKRLLVAR